MDIDIVPKQGGFPSDDELPTTSPTPTPYPDDEDDHLVDDEENFDDDEEDDDNDDLPKTPTPKLPLVQRSAKFRVW